MDSEHFMSRSFDTMLVFITEINDTRYKGQVRYSTMYLSHRIEMKINAHGICNYAHSIYFSLQYTWKWFKVGTLKSSYWSNVKGVNKLIKMYRLQQFIYSNLRPPTMCKWSFTLSGFWRNWKKHAKICMLFNVSCWSRFVALECVKHIKIMKVK